MCCDGSTVILPAFLVILGAHWWIWSLNRQNLVSINVFGQMIHNVAISDIFAVTAIATSTLLLIVEICSWCRSIGGCDPRMPELNQLKQRRFRLKENVKNLERKLEKLKKMTDRIKLLIPYDLNTMVEQEMFDHIPSVTFSPNRAVPPPSKPVTASFHLKDHPLSGTQSINHMMTRSPMQGQRLPRSPRRRVPGPVTGPHPLSTNSQTFTVSQSRSNAISTPRTPRRNPVNVSMSNSKVQSPKLTLSFSPSHNISIQGNNKSPSLLKSTNLRSPDEMAK